MIRLASFVLCSTLFASTFAQRPDTTAPNDDEMETLVDLTDFTIGAYAGPLVKYASINGDWITAIGLEGGVRFFNAITVGGKGVGFASAAPMENYWTSPNPVYTGDEEYEEETYIYTGYGGVFVEYVYRWRDVVHLSASVTYGGGIISVFGDLKEDAIYDRDDPLPSGQENIAYADEIEHESGAFSVIEPELAAEANVSSFLRATFSLGYRFASDVDVSKLDDDDVSGLIVSVGFRFGFF
jgi:hypothetical protein